MEITELLERLIAFNTGLLPDMLELKYEAMAENAFRFFRGTCHLFYEDLAAAAPLPLSPLAWIAATFILRTLVATGVTISWFILISMILMKLYCRLRLMNWCEWLRVFLLHLTS